MTLAKQIKKTLKREMKKDRKSKDYNYAELFRKKVLEQRQRSSTSVKLDKPTNLPRAHSLGYKAKEGIFVALTRVRKGSGMHKRPVKGRRPKRMGVTKLTRRLSRQAMAEKKAGRKFPNCEVMNSYWVGADGRYTYYEVIMADIASMPLRADRERNKIASNKHKRRAERGLTSAGKKSRGLKKGKGHEKNYPSVRANKRKAK